LHDGELEQRLAMAMREHVSTCGECSRDLHELEDLSGWFRADQTGEMSDAELSRLHASVDQLIEQAEPRLLMFPWVRAISAAAASFVVIAAAWMSQGPRTTPTVVKPTSMPEWAYMMFGENAPPDIPQSGFADADLANYFLDNLPDGGAHAKTN